MTDYRGVVDEINSGSPHAPLVLAWHLLTGGKGAKKAKLTAIEKNSFTIAVDGKEEEKFALKEDFINPSEAKKRILTLTEKCLIVPFPSEKPLTWITILLWVTLIFVCIVDPNSSGPHSSNLITLRSYLLNIYRTDLIASYLLAGLVISHTLEAMYVFYLLKSIKSQPRFSMGDINTWASMTMLLGFPVTTKAFLLNKADATKVKPE